MEDLPLSGVRVLEAGSGIPAAFAARWLAGFGADVVRLEPAQERLTPDEAAYLLPGKRRVNVDPSRLPDLALAADIVIEDSTPGTLANLGADPATLRARKPSLVIVSITPFGQTGPHAAYQATNAVSFASGGLMSLTGRPDRPPLVTGGSQAEYLGGMNGAGAALTTYFGSLVHGEGDWVDISLQECAAGMLELQGPRTAYEGPPAMLRSGNHARAVWGIYPCADGYAGVCCLERQIPAFFSLVADPALKDERFTDVAQRPLHDDELQAVLYPWFAAHTKREIIALSPIHRVPLGAVLTPLDLLENESLNQREFFETINTPSGTARVPGRPFLGLPWRTGELHAPGADTAAVLHDWLGAAP